MSAVDIDALIAAAREGDRTAFDRLAELHLHKLRATVRRMIGHPEDTDDVVQEALFKASQSLPAFRGEATFGTWLCSIGVNAALDFLRKQKPWRVRAQVIYANRCHTDEALQAEIGGAVMSPDFQYDAHEHIAYCWTCVARSLPAEQNAALVLREFMDLSNGEAARSLGLTESVFRHRLSEARRHMEREFEGLCALINKDGVCYQCKGLRDSMPASRQGAAAPHDFSFEQRIQWIKRADLDGGTSRPLHDVFYRRTQQCETTGVGDAEEDSLCKDT